MLFISRHVSQYIYLCILEHLPAARLEVTTFDKPSHLLSIITGGKFEFFSRRQKRFSEMCTLEYNFCLILAWNYSLCFKEIVCQISQSLIG